MKRPIKYSKILLVMFITVLVWIWADKSLDSDYTAPVAAIKLDQAAAGNLYALFDSKPEALIENILLQGPASQIDDIKGDIQSGQLTLDFFFVPQDERMAEPGTYKLDVLDFIKKNNLISELRVTAEDCEPNNINVEIIKLEEKQLTVKCKRDNGSEITAKTIEPAKVQMLVPEYWSGESLVAYVTLTYSEINQARVSAVLGTPSIDFPPGIGTQAERAVKITMPAETEDLIDYTITGATVGFVYSPTLNGIYKAELSNPEDFAIINIKATAAAHAAYKEKAFKVYLEILDGDKDATEGQKREVVYNFPAEFVSDGKIKLSGKPAEAKFTLVPLVSEKSVSAPNP